jgi:phosphocarrier protein HPr
MYTQNVTIMNKTGLHARPAFMFVQAASKFKSNITVKKADKTASSKSIVNILALGISKDTEITITAEGEDEKEAVNALISLINSKFGEA